MHEYLYNDNGYKHSSIHRKAVVYDPLNTDNPIILDYLHIAKSKKDTRPVYYKIIDLQLDKYKSQSTIDIPISFDMLWHEMNMNWVYLIQQMIFTDNAYETFYAEYKDVLDNVILHDTLDNKETLIYRYHNSGESMFHIAAKLWLFSHYVDNKNKVNFNLDKDMKYILECYARLETCFGHNRKYCISYMTDFSGMTLIDYLQEFCDMVVASIQNTHGVE